MTDFEHLHPRGDAGKFRDKFAGVDDGGVTLAAEPAATRDATYYESLAARAFVGEVDYRRNRATTRITVDDTILDVSTDFSKSGANGETGIYRIHVSARRGNRYVLPGMDPSLRDCDAPGPKSFSVKRLVAAHEQQREAFARELPRALWHTDNAFIPRNYVERQRLGIDYDEFTDPWAAPDVESDGPSCKKCGDELDDSAKNGYCASCYDDCFCAVEGCENPLDDGEGFAGLCGDHADRVEAIGEGAWDDWNRSDVLPDSVVEA